MRTSIAVLALAGLAATAHADIVDMYFSSTGRGQNVHVAAGDRSFNTFAGQLMHQVVGGTGTGADLVGLNAFYCVDIYEYASHTTSPFTITTLTEVPDSQPMSAGAAGGISSIFAAADGQQFQSDAPTAFTAAFQLAVWEIASDFDDQLGASSLDLSNGWFRASGAGGAVLSPQVLAYAEDLFDAVGQGLQFDGEVFAMRSDVRQDQISSRTIPTPGSTASLACGLLLIIRRRRH